MSPNSLCYSVMTNNLCELWNPWKEDAFSHRQCAMGLCDSLGQLLCMLAWYSEPHQSGVPGSHLQSSKCFWAHYTMGRATWRGGTSWEVCDCHVCKWLRVTCVTSHHHSMSGVTAFGRMKEHKNPIYAGFKENWTLLNSGCLLPLFLNSSISHVHQ